MQKMSCFIVFSFVEDIISNFIGEMPRAARRICRGFAIMYGMSEVSKSPRRVEKSLGKWRIWLAFSNRRTAMKRMMVVFCCAAMVASSAAMAGTNNADIVAAARKQIGVTVGYDPAYVRLEYPNGDVARSSGVCTDVIIRALRDARKVDLQKLIHEDMKTSFAKYPQNWGLKKPDANIDHRRVPNLQCYFKRKGWSLKASKTASDYEPGDFVTVTVGGRLPHIMIVSDKKAADGTPLVIHNIGSGTKEENCLFAYPLTGHYRVK